MASFDTALSRRLGFTFTIGPVSSELNGLLDPILILVLLLYGELVSCVASCSSLPKYLGESIFGNSILGKPTD
jgi:hypothetical protein